MRDSTDMSSRTPSPRSGGDPVLASVPIGVLIAERSLLMRALDRTVEAGDRRAEAAARRCIGAVEDELLAREEC